MESTEKKSKPVENERSVQLNTLGATTKRQYAGAFLVKGILNRRDQFTADANRRRIIGPNPADAMPALQGEAYMLGQLHARVLEAPEWWVAAQNGEILEDSNIISELYELALDVETAVKKDLTDAANIALDKMKKDLEKDAEKTEKEASRPPAR